MAMKSEAAKALRGYRKEVEAQIARAEAKLVELRAEMERIESALTTIGGDGGAGSASGTAPPPGAADRSVAVVDVAKRLGLGRSRARALLSELKQRGVLSSEREGKGPRARELYSLPQRTSGSGSRGSSSSRRKGATST